MRVLAIDPGTHKVGVVVVDIEGREYTVQYRAIVPVERVEEALQRLVPLFQPERFLVGKGTGLRALVPRLKAIFPQVKWEQVEERHTTLQARELYFVHHPPRGWRRWLPKGLRIPPEPYDDYAALALALQVCASD